MPSNTDVRSEPRYPSFPVTRMRIIVMPRFLVKLSRWQPMSDRAIELLVFCRSPQSVDQRLGRRVLNPRLAGRACTGSWHRMFGRRSNPLEPNFTPVRINRSRAKHPAIAVAGLAVHTVQNDAFIFQPDQLSSPLINNLSDS